MNYFKIGKDEFGIGKYDYELKNDEIYLRIYGDDEIFDSLCEADDSEWNWALDAPYLYFEGIPFVKNKKIELKEELLDSCDFALYMMEHNEITGKMLINDKFIELNGNVDIIGEVYPLSVHLDL